VEEHAHRDGSVAPLSSQSYSDLFAGQLGLLSSQEAWYSVRSGNPLAADSEAFAKDSADAPL